MNRRIMSNIFLHSMKNVISGETISMIKDIFRNKAIYEVDLSNQVFFLEPILVKLCPNFTFSIDTGFKESPDGNEFYMRKRLSDVVNNIQFIRYKGTPIVIRTVIPKDRDKYSSRDLNLLLTTIKTEENIKKLNQFIYMLSKKRHAWGLQKQSREICMVQSDGCCHILDKKVERSFDSVFIPKAQKEILLKSIDSYVSRYNWYHETNIPNHFGILLHGGSGMGKSSIAQAIAHYMNASIYVMNGDNLDNLNNVIARSIPMSPWTKKEYRILLIEDVDCGILSHDRKVKVKEKRNDDGPTEEKAGLGTILNLLDGINSPTNIIYIFTTNHIEHLDPAIIRPGRLDLHLEIGPVCNETLDYFCMFHYNQHIPENIVIKDNMTFAQLQVEIMRGATFEDLVEYVKA